MCGLAILKLPSPIDAPNGHWAEHPHFEDWVFLICRLLNSFFVIDKPKLHVFSQHLHGLPPTCIPHIKFPRAAPASPLCGCASD